MGGLLGSWHESQTRVHAHTHTQTYQSLTMSSSMDGSAEHGQGEREACLVVGMNYKRALTHAHKHTRA